MRSRATSGGNRRAGGGRTSRRALLFGAAVAVAATALPAPARFAIDPGAIARASVDTRGVEGNGPSGGHTGPAFLFAFRLPPALSSVSWGHWGDAQPGLSADGRHVAFSSTASNLVRHDSNGWTDVFVRDRDPDRNGTFDEVGGVLTTRVSLTHDGRQANGHSAWPGLSGDGRFVAFSSLASNLTAQPKLSCPTNTPAEPLQPCFDVFLRDRDADGDGLYDDGAPGATKTVWISLKADGTQARDVSGHSFAPAVSDDGRHVTFVSWSASLSDEDDDTCGPSDNIGACADVFVHDRDADADGVMDEPDAVRTVLVSRAADGTPGNAHSGGAPPYPSTRPPAMTPDGRFIAYHSWATNLTPGDPAPGPGPHVYLHDRDADADGVFDEAGAVATTRIPEPPTPLRTYRSVYPSLSADARYVAYQAAASIRPGAGDLQPGIDIDGESRLFVFDRPAGTTREVPFVAGAGVQAGTRPFSPWISGNGRWLAFTTAAANSTAAGDRGHVRLDVWLHDRDVDEDGVYDEVQPDSYATIRVSFGGFARIEPADSDSWGAAISRNGRAIGFITNATNLVAGIPLLFAGGLDTNGYTDVYVRTRGFGWCPFVTCV